jgi:hypothetical protein
MSEIVEHVNIGRYFYDGYESPQEVANTVYGDAHRYPAILKANPDGLEAGTWIDVPNKKGRQSKVLEGESTTQFIQRLYKGQPTHLYVDRYLMWNGNFMAEDLVGMVVFIPER